MAARSWRGVSNCPEKDRTGPNHHNSPSREPGVSNSPESYWDAAVNASFPHTLLMDTNLPGFQSFSLRKALLRRGVRLLPLWLCEELPGRARLLCLVWSHLIHLFIKSGSISLSLSIALSWSIFAKGMYSGRCCTLCLLDH